MTGLARRLGYVCTTERRQETGDKGLVILLVFGTDCCGLQVKYFKEKRVMEHNRDKTIERIKQEDAETKAQGRKN